MQIELTEQEAKKVVAALTCIANNTRYSMADEQHILNTKAAEYDKLAERFKNSS